MHPICDEGIRSGSLGLAQLEQDQGNGIRERVVFCSAMLTPTTITALRPRAHVYDSVSGPQQGYHGQGAGWAI